MLLKALRIGLGQLVVFVDWISRPRKLKRSPEAQAEVERATANLALYQFHACPFCVKVRRTLHRLNLPVQLRDAKHDHAAVEVVVVPPLRPTTWPGRSR